MLTLTIEGTEVYDESTETFSTIDDVVLHLEHSLISLSKWESKHQKPFLSTIDKTSEEIFDYLQMMIVTPGADPNVLYNCSKKDLITIQEYIDSPQSATTFSKIQELRGRQEVITAELIYYWMASFQLPFECETWHLNRLFALIKICGIKQSNPKKVPKHEIAQRNRELNAQRKAQLGTTG